MIHKKIIVIILIFVLSIFFVCTTSMADSPDSAGGGEDAMSGLWQNSSLASVKAGVDVEYNSGLFGGINTIIGLIQMAGTGISLIMVTMLGIKYILASVEEKAEIKKTAMPIVIGAVLLFGATNIMAAVAEFGNILN